LIKVVFSFYDLDLLWNINGKETTLKNSEFILVMAFIFPGGIVFLLNLYAYDLGNAVIYGPLFWGAVGYFISRR
jgi:hypothetical protein